MTVFAGKLVMGVAAAALLGGTAMAQDTKGENVSSEAGTVSEAAVGVEQSVLAAQLASYGREAGSPMALMLAGQMLADAGSHDEAREKLQEGTPAESGEAKSGEAAELTAPVLFAEAKAMAGTDSELVARIERVADRQSKGRVGGPARHVDRVLSRSQDTYTISFRGGELARVAAVGDGDTDLDLRIYDSNGNLICSDLDYTDQTYCSWTPAWTGNFQVKIRNLGDVYNQYTLYTN